MRHLELIIVFCLIALTNQVVGRLPNVKGLTPTSPATKEVQDRVNEVEDEIELYLRSQGINGAVSDLKAISCRLGIVSGFTGIYFVKIEVSFRNNPDGQIYVHAAIWDNRPRRGIQLSNIKMATETERIEVF